jgi:hypothetical protein
VLENTAVFFFKSGILHEYYRLFWRNTAVFFCTGTGRYGNASPSPALSFFIFYYLEFL